VHKLHLFRPMPPEVFEAPSFDADTDWRVGATSETGLPG